MCVISDEAILKFIIGQNICCMNNEQLVEYIKNILCNCPFEGNANKVLEDNLCDIKLTAIFINSFGDCVGTNGCVGYTKNNKIVVTFVDGMTIVFRVAEDGSLVKDMVETKHFVDNIEEIVKTIESILMNNRKLVEDWIYELNNSKIK